MTISKESITTVVYDADFTLWDSDFDATCELVAKHFRVPRSLRYIFVKTLRKSIFQALDLASNHVVTPELLAKHLDALMHEVLEVCNLSAIDVVQASRNPDFARAKPKPDAEDTVMYIWKSNRKQILKSNWWAEVQIVLLRKFNLYPYFEAVYGPLWSYFKPHAAAAKKFLKGMNPEHFLMVGDSLEHDIKFAKNTGMQSVWLNPSGDINTTDIQPDATIKRLGELTDIL